MKETTKKVYYCDHCNKHGLSKDSMSRHEKWCTSNPENRRACQGCQNLEEIKIKYTATVDGGYDDYPSERETTGFRCKALDKKLYPLKCEKKDLPNKYPGTFDDQEPMPKTCEHYKSELFK